MITFLALLGKITGSSSSLFPYHQTNICLPATSAFRFLKIAVIALFTIIGNQAANAQVYLLDGSNTQLTFNTCSGTFYDSGSSGGSYGAYEDYTITFCSTTSDPIVITFNYIDLESGWDYLYVYDGPSSASPQMTGSPISGFSAPTFTSSGTCITFVFQSDGSGNYPGWEALISCGAPAGGGDYNNPGGNISTCSGNFYDSGGQFGNYGPNQNVITTICADELDQCLSMNFSSFNIESGWDYLDIYDGPSTASPLIGWYTGTAGPGQITASGSCLTFHFTSDGSFQYSGWSASISCFDCDSDPSTDPDPPGCPSIDITDNLELDCATPCVDLTAEVTETGLTTSYDVSAINYNPPYPFTGGTPLFIGTDDIWGPMVNLPFNFCFYGAMYDQITVGANGIISFNAAYANAFCPWAFNATIPSAVLPVNSIFGAYHDMNPAVGGNINYAILGEAPCRTFVVNFNGVPHYSCTSINTTQQIVIYETTNIIDVYILNKPTCFGWNSGNALIGIQNATGAVGITPPGRNTGSWSANNEAWRFTPNGPPNYVVNWYDEQNNLIGNGLSVQVCPSSDATYTGEVIYQHCDGSQVIETDQVTITVAESFTLEATPVPVSCPGECDGSVSVAVTDGLAPFTYDIGNGAQNNGNFSGLCAGNHQVEVEDANGCIVVVQFEVEEPAALDPGLDNSIEVCESDAAFSLFDQLNGTPETGGQWYDSSNSPVSGTFDPASSSAGTYTYVLGDPSCIYSAEVTVAINPILTSTQDFTICEDEEVTLPDGTQVNTSGSYDVTLSSVVTGCDSTITTNVTVNPLLTSTQDIAICEGEQATLPDGTEVSAAGSYDVVLSSVVTGCDSTVTTNVTVNPLLTSTQDIAICEGEQATLPDGTEVSTAGSFDVVLSSAVTGCDSTVTTNVSINPLLTSTQDFTICEDEEVTLPDGTLVNTTGSYDVVLSSAITGCDSTITTNVTVNPLLTSTQDFTICEDEEVSLPDGTIVNTTGSYDVVLSSVVTGCDSTITTNVTVNPLLTSSQDFTICEDDQVTLPDGTQVNTTGSYDVVLSSVVTGCDSTVTTNVTVNLLLTSTVDITICEDEEVTLPDGTIVNSAGSYDVVLSSAVTGCDSTVTTNVTVNPLLTSTVDITICEDEEVTLPDGTLVNTAGSYDVVLSSLVTGCDSTITTNVTVNPLLTSTQDFTICEDEEVTLPDGTQVNTAGSYDVVLSSVVTGCDSTVTTNVSINPLLTSTQDFTICEDEEVTLPDGTLVNTTGSYDVVLSSVVTGCDSTVTTNVTVNPLLTSTQDFTICEDEEVTLPDGTIVNTTGSYDVLLSSVVTGCDSTVTTNVTVNPLLTSTQDFTICEDEEVTLPDGTQVNTAGSYDVVLSSIVTGCDSTITTNVTVNPLLTSTQDFTICEDEEVTLPDGTQVNTTGSYDVVLSSVVTGCDSTITTNVTVNPLLASTQEFTICEDEEVTLPDGTQVNTAGSYDVVLSSVVTGCDSTVTTNVTVNPLLTSTVDITICEDEEVTLPDGTQVNTAGSYDVILSSAVTGCDSTVTTNVTVNPLLTSFVDIAICEDEEVTLPDGTQVNTSGSYDVVLSSIVTGCDSTVTTNVTVNPLLSSTEEFTICEDEQIILMDGTPVFVAGTYETLLSSEITGCDSLVTTIVAVNPLLTSTQDFTICEGEEVTLPDGTTVNTAGSYDVVLSSLVTGCDSTVTTNVTVNPLLTSTQNFTICEDEQVTLPDGTQANTPGSYDVVLSSAITGCDSTVTTNVTVNPLLATTTDITICEDEQVTLPDGTLVNTAGSYDVVLPSVITGCDSTVTTNVSVVNLISVANLVETCAPSGSTYTLAFEISGGDPSSYTVTGITGNISGANPATFTSNPIAEGTTYNISVADGNACNTISLTGTVSCSCIATAALSGGATICEGDNSDLTFNFVGAGPFSVTYSDGSSTYTLNGVSDGHTVSVSPSSTTTYTLVSMSDLYCSGNTSGSATITVNTIPDAGSNNTLTLCENDTPINLFGILNGSPDAGGTWAAPDGSTFTNPLNPQSDVPGVYTYTVEGIAPCPDATATITVDILNEITVSDVTEVCESSGATYTVSFEISGGDPSSYSVTGLTGILTPGNPATFTSDPIASGDSYDVTVEDANACNSIELSGLVVCDCPVSAAISGGAVICMGGSADIEFTLVGGGPFDVVYSDGTDEFNLNGIVDGHVVSVNPLTSTTYTLVSVENSVCPGTISGSAVITVNQPVDAGEDATLTVCINTGTENLFDLLGGSPNMGGTWTAPDGTSFTNPFDPQTDATGVYTYFVDASAPCPDASATVTVDILNEITVSDVTEECQANGAAYTVSFEISGGDPSSYSVTGITGTLTPGSPATFTSDPIASGGSYDITVEDGNACNSIELSGLVVCDCPVSAAISGGANICLGSDADIEFALEGDGPFDVVYSDGTDEFSLNGISDGHIVSVSPLESTTYTLVSVSNSICPGTVSGSAMITIGLPVDAGLDGSLTVCADAETQILFDLLGGNPAGNGSWISPDGSDFDGQFNPASDQSGTYTYTVLGGVCPDDFAEVDVVINPLPHAEILGDASICDGNLANLQLELSGSAPWTVVYAIDGVAQPAITTSDADYIIETGEEGVYTLVSVSDLNCTGTTSGNGTVSINDSPTASISGQEDICPGAEAELNITLTGASPWMLVYSIDGTIIDTLEINTANYTLTTGTEGVYEIVQLNDANCPGLFSGSAEVSFLPGPDAVISGGGPICYGDSTLIEIDLEGTGNIEFVYSFNGVNQSATSTAGVYSFYASESGVFELISVEDESCTGLISGIAEVFVNDLPTATLSDGVAICTGDTASIQIVFTGQAPFTIDYTLDGVAQSAQSTADTLTLYTQAAGVYELQAVTDGNCSNGASGLAEIVVHELPTGTMTGGGEICAGENEEIVIEFTGSGNWEFVVSIDDIVQEPVNTNLTPYFIYTDETSTYDLVAVSDDFCIGTTQGQAEVDVAPLPTANLTGNSSICDGQNATLVFELTGSGPWTIGYAIDGVQQPPLQANNSPFELSTSTVGEYSLLSVADANCIGTTSGIGIVQENPIPTAHISGNALLCPTDSTTFMIELTGTAPYTITYSINGVPQPPIESVDDLYELVAQQAGTYNIESVSDINCTNFGTGAAILEHAPTPTAILTGGGTFCAGEMGNVAILFTGEGPWTFEYAIDGEVFGPTTTPSNSYTLFDDITGTYTLVSVSDMNCSGSFSGEAYVEFGGSPQVDISPGGKVCPGEFVELWAEGSGGAPPYSYQWFNTNDDSWVQFDDTVSVLGNTVSGIYVVVTDQCGGTAYSDTSWVEPELVPLSSFNFAPRHNVTVKYTTIEFNSETSLFAYGLQWIFYELTEYSGWQQIGTSYGPNPTFTFPDDKPGLYQACLYVHTEAGCVDELCLPIEILDDFVFYMPNTFTPNEDGLNDLYGPVMENVDPSGYEFLIVNRWGETVFYTNDINQKWDGSGMKGGYYAPDGVYSWKVRVRQLDASDAVEFKGHVNLLR